MGSGFFPAWLWLLVWGCFMAGLGLPSVSSVSRRACQFGASGFSVRPSSRSLSGFVACAGFASSALAADFARYACGRLPRMCGGCVVRAAGGLHWVSVPVSVGSVPPPVLAGSPISACGSPPAVRAGFVAAGWA